jgi:hypothetical protein
MKNSLSGLVPKRTKGKMKKNVSADLEYCCDRIVSIRFKGDKPSSRHPRNSSTSSFIQISISPFPAGQCLISIIELLFFRGIEMFPKGKPLHAELAIFQASAFVSGICIHTLPQNRCPHLSLMRYSPSTHFKQEVHAKR